MSEILRVDESSIDADTESRLLDIYGDFPTELSMGMETEALAWLQGRSDEAKLEIIRLTQDIPEKLELVKEGHLHGLVIHGEQPSFDDIGSTPLVHNNPDRAQIYKQYIIRFAIISTLSGTYPYGFTTQQSGAVANDMLVVPELERTLYGKSASTTGSLGHHNEDASLNRPSVIDGAELGGVSPDFIVLHFFRNPSLTPVIISAPDFEEFSEEEIDILTAPNFTSTTNPSHGVVSGRSEYRNSIFYTPDSTSTLALRINTVGMLPTVDYPDERGLALQKLIVQLDQNSKRLEGAAGDIVIINNRTATHAKAEELTGGDYSCGGRWQQRTVYASDGPNRLEPHLIKPHLVETENFLSLYV